MTYDEALKYIHAISWTGSRPGLERISELCAYLGNPQDELEFIHVAGTNGKGSFCSMMSSVLCAKGLKVGVFTSPFVYRFNERIAIGYNPISDRELAEVVEYVKGYADKMTDAPTEFELITAVGFEYFKRQKCDVVILEAGMGGRLDSTNIIKKSKLSVITGIDLDHTAILGDTCEKIAFEKAGIIKENCPVVCGKCKTDGAARVIKETAENRNATFTQTDYGRLSKVSLNSSGATFDFEGYGEPFKLSLAGAYQPENAALVISACEILRIDEEFIRNGLENAVWHARFEKLSDKPLIFFDGGHNPQGVCACIKSVKEIFNEKINIVTGVMADKDYKGMAKMIAEIANKVYCVSPDNPRALDCEEYAKVYRDIGVESEAFSSVNKAVEKAITESLENGKVLLGLGSLYMYKEFYDAVKGCGFFSV